MVKPEELLDIIKSGGDYLYIIGHADLRMAMPKLHSLLTDAGGVPRKGTLILDFVGATVELETPYFERSVDMPRQRRLIADMTAFDWIEQEFEKSIKKCPACGHRLDG